MAKAAATTTKTKTADKKPIGIPAEEARATALNQNGNALPRVTEEIPLSQIVVSPFEPQARRRARFKPEEIQELADSIRIDGLIHAIKVRPVRYSNIPTERIYEIVVGERRYLAHGLNKAEIISATIEDLDDEAAFRQQMAENLERKDPHPMDEAFSYSFLQKTIEEKRDGTVTADELALIIGKPVKHILGRLKLNALITEAQDDVEDGHLPLTHAMEMAKYAPDAQTLILGRAYETQYDSKAMRQVPNKDRPVRFPVLLEWIENNILLRLAQAPFDKTATDLRKDGLACINCAQRTGANASLFEKDQLGKNDSCLDPVCFKGKAIAHVNLRRAAIAAEKEIKVSDVAFVHTHSHSGDKEYLGLESFTLIDEKYGSDDWCEHIETAINVFDNHKHKFGTEVKICRSNACKAHGKKTPGKAAVTSNVSAKKQAEIDAQARVERLNRKEEIFDTKIAHPVRLRVLKECTKAFDAKTTVFTLPEADELTRRIIARMWRLQCSDSSSVADDIRKALDISDTLLPTNWYQLKQEHIDNLSDDQRSKLLFLLLYSHEEPIGVGGYFTRMKLMEQLAERYGVDYQMLDAVERLGQAPVKEKQRFRDYIEKLEAGDRNAKVPRLYSDKYKVKE